MANTSLKAAFARMWQKTKEYTDNEIADLINGAPTTLDTLGEIATAMSENAEVVEALDQAIGSKADKVHTHTKSQITDFPTSMPASDVSAWAKASTKPTYTASEVGAVPTSRKVNGKILSADITLDASDVNALNKTTYEYNTELSMGSSGKVCIGKFPMYDSNVSVEIKSTTTTAYNGTLIIATQNINTTGGGSYSATVYGDAGNKLTNSIKIHYGSGSNVFSVYIDLPAWSKNLLHIQCSNLPSAPSDIATSVTEIPSNATIVPTNALNTNYLSSNTKYAGSSSVGGSAISAVKLDTTTAGSATQPVYFANGKPTACTYTLSKSVPSDAKFTDTTYSSLKNPYALTIQGNGTTLTNGTYDGSAAKTVNITASFIGAAPSTHNHAASQITSGTLPVARGGTGVTSLDSLKSSLGISGDTCINLITTSGTWTAPTTSNQKFHVIVVGGGGGGGGSLPTGSSDATGGGGGGGGYITVKDLTIAAGTSVTITIGAGGAGGANRTSDVTYATNGSSGGTTSFGSLASAAGGKGGGAAGQHGVGYGYLPGYGGDGGSGGGAGGGSFRQNSPYKCYGGNGTFGGGGGGPQFYGNGLTGTAYAGNGGTYGGGGGGGSNNSSAGTGGTYGGNGGIFNKSSGTSGKIFTDPFAYILYGTYGIPKDPISQKVNQNDTYTGAGGGFGGQGGANYGYGGGGGGYCCNGGIGSSAGGGGGGYLCNGGRGMDYNYNYAGGGGGGFLGLPTGSSTTYGGHIGYGCGGYGNGYPGTAGCVCIIYNK